MSISNITNISHDFSKSCVPYSYSVWTAHFPDD